MRSLFTRLKLGKQWRDALLTALIIALAIALASVLALAHNDNNPFAVPVFILAVALVARFTDGFFWGILASVAGVLCVNFIFTYPYWEFNMSLEGYPLTFFSMLVVSLTISTLTTQIKRQEQLRFEMEAEKMRADLLRSVSHDLRTPLTSILGASSVLLENEELAAADRRELLTGIQTDAKWLIRVTENILSVTRLGGGVNLRKEPEVVEEVVGSAVVKFHASYPDVPVSVARPSRILLAPMDATLIVQVLINLLENAVLHGGATHIQTRISLEGDRVSIAVEDDGRGIAPALLPHVFEAGFTTRGDADGRRSMGIGLSVCRTIVRAHGGEITASNLPGGGGCLRFWLPGEKEDEIDEEPI